MQPYRATSVTRRGLTSQPKAEHRPCHHLLVIGDLGPLCVAHEETGRVFEGVHNHLVHIASLDSNVVHHRASIEEERVALLLLASEKWRILWCETGGAALDRRHYDVLTRVEVPVAFHRTVVLQPYDLAQQRWESPQVVSSAIVSDDDKHVVGAVVFVPPRKGLFHPLCSTDNMVPSTVGRAALARADALWPQGMRYVGVSWHDGTAGTSQRAPVCS